VCLINKAADLSLKNNNGWSLLHRAAQGWNVKIIEKLLSLGLDIDSKKSHGATPLMVAANNGRPEAFGCLINEGADLSLKEKNGWFCTWREC